jgi:protein-disulfide isomerase
MVVRCAGADAFYPLAEQYMKTQDVWARAAGEEIGAEIQKIARINGLTAGQLNTCLADQDYARKLIEDFQTHAEADGVDSTPTFLINGEKVKGNRPDEIFALIDSQL